MVAILVGKDKDYGCLITRMMHSLRTLKKHLIDARRCGWISKYVIYVCSTYLNGQKFYVVAKHIEITNSLYINFHGYWYLQYFHECSIQAVIMIIKLHYTQRHSSEQFWICIAPSWCEYVMQIPNGSVCKYQYIHMSIEALLLLPPRKLCSLTILSGPCISGFIVFLFYDTGTSLYFHQK